MIEVKISYHIDFLREAREWSLSFGPNIEDRVNLGLNYIDALEKLIRESDGSPKEMELYGNDVPQLYRLPLAATVWVVMSITNPPRRIRHPKQSQDCQISQADSAMIAARNASTNSA